MEELQEKKALASRFLFCAGIRRSASTWLYQIAKEIAEKNNVGVGQGFVFHNIVLENIDLPEDKIGILKTHAWLPQAQSYISEGYGAAIMTVRDPRDVAASIMEFKKQSFNAVYWMEMPAVNREFEHWFEYAAAVHKYEDLWRDLSARKTLVRDVADLLGVDVSDQQIMEILKKYSLPAQKKRIEEIEDRDKEDSWLHHNHILDPVPGRWKKLMTKEQSEMIIEITHPAWRDLYEL